MTQLLHDSFFVHAPRVFEVHASRTPQGENEGSWTANAYPDVDGGYIVIAELSSSSEEGTVSVTLGAVFQPAGSELEPAQVSSTIESSTAFETLYDVARQAAHGVTGLTHVDLKFGVKAPAGSVTYHPDGF